MAAPDRLVASARSSRRPELDALRAFAMLLGIALHGAMAYFPAAWPVQDSQQLAGFGTFVSAIHGFRMQLFFMLAGFFTAMNWRRKGLPELVKNRFQRVFIPCMLGLVTVIPLLHWVAARVTEPSTSIRREYRAGDELNKPDTQFKVTPLSWASLQGDLDMAERLVESGADVNGRNGDGSTPLHSAAFLGQEELVRYLLSKGADPILRDANGGSPSDSARADAATTQFLISYLRLPPRPQSQIQAGRDQLLPLLPKSDRPSVVTAHPPPGPREAYHAFLVAGPLSRLITTNVFDHLWFLWDLSILVALFALWAKTGERKYFQASERFREWVITPRRYLWLIPATLIPHLLMGMFGYSFGPDTATGWIPPPHLLAYYGIFFFFGVAYFVADDSLSQLGRHGYLTVPFALLVVFPMALFTQPINRPLSDFLQICYAWLMITGGIGLCRGVFANENPGIRYVSDASYWMYLIHLPLIMALQSIMTPVPLVAPVKFSVLMLFSLTLLLASYQLLVKNTLVGVVLNGRRTPKA